MDDESDIIAAWIAREIVPHEGRIRNWLSRRWHHVIDIEDVIQEAYCRIASLASVDHIDNPAGYFHRTVNAVATDMMRRAGIINFTSMTQIEWSNVIDGKPSADRALEACQELERVDGLLARLSDTYRKVIELRRIEGLSRKETAERLGVSENDVKNYLVRGLRKIMQTMAEQDARMDGDDDEREANDKKVEVIGTHRPR
ncbi:RNA polymerase sigma factor [Novosphingobium album (ex Liu et al. 2023)]|uniref:RNA polymerase sigma factor n=1 Tax=Novosphingobium album (ex Liu et al. 2023) TaxID=3031130 RepID=A0ABT5WME0_9SPHN|nr:RNA polymerase sigma factor [Novosphingobium album (ex Liu et al. 2023)]MDE8651220.1 RNA polymerase sigma factor [Novosphingobium album (ex Liu et al. 2023)]